MTYTAYRLIGVFSVMSYSLYFDDNVIYVNIAVSVAICAIGVGIGMSWEFHKRKVSHVAHLLIGLTAYWLHHWCVD